MSGLLKRFDRFPEALGLDAGCRLEEGLARKFDWDPTKATTNARKHEVDFLDAVDVFEDPDHVREVDDRFNYGEVRERIIGRVGDTLLSVMFTERDGLTRLISARKASRSERKRYRRHRSG